MSKPPSKFEVMRARRMERERRAAEIERQFAEMRHWQAVSRQMHPVFYDGHRLSEIQEVAA